METQNGNEPTKNGPGRFGSSRFCFGGNASKLELPVTVCAKGELRSQRVLNGAHKALPQQSQTTYPMCHAHLHLKALPELYARKYKHYRNYTRIIPVMLLGVYVRSFRLDIIIWL